MDRLVYYPPLLKIVVFVQIIFSTWGYLIPPQGYFMPETYSFSHLILLLFGALSVSKPGSSDLVLMYLLVNLFTILNDIMLLGLFQPVADLQERNPATPARTLNTYRFALGMSIVNLILKPIICFVLFRIYQIRGGSLMEELTSVRGHGQSYNGYDNPDDSNVETASPHQSIDNSS